MGHVPDVNQKEREEEIPTKTGTKRKGMCGVTEQKGNNGLLPGSATVLLWSPVP